MSIPFLVRLQHPCPPLPSPTPREVPSVHAADGWLTKAHPDPDGKRLGLVVEFLHGRVGSNEDSWALFWDFASLPQFERAAEDEVKFKKALGSMSILYGSTKTTVLVLDEIPVPDVGPMEPNELTTYNRTPYECAPTLVPPSQL